MGRTGKEEAEFQFSWAPPTTMRPILPKPAQIYDQRAVNQMNQGNWLGSEGISGFPGENQANTFSACLEGRVNELQARAYISRGCNPLLVDPTAEFSNVPFTHLLDLANAATRGCFRPAVPRNDSVTTGSSVTTLDSQSDSNQVEPSSAAPWFTEVDFNQTQIDAARFSPGKPQNGGVSSEAMVRANSDKSVSEFAPITPEKGMRVGRKEASIMEILQADDRINGDKGGNKLTARTEDSSNGDLQEPATGSSMVITPPENESADKGDSQVNEIGETPQQKPKRKKHRPRVITEKKPRTPKPKTPNSNGAQENSTGKRKYVRKKAVIDSATPPEEASKKAVTDWTTPPAEASGKQTPNKRKYVRKKDLNKEPTTPVTKDNEETSTAPAPGLNKRSCRRALNFDDDGIEEVEASAFEAARNNKESGKNAPASEEQAPTTPPPAKIKRPRGRPKANSQKQDIVEGKDQATTQNGSRQNADAEIMPKTYSRRPTRGTNNFASLISSSSGEEQKRKLNGSNSNSAEPEFRITNADGCHYTNLCKYQAMSCFHFPNIHKRKRTEPSQHCATTGVPSLIAAQILIPQGAYAGHAANEVPATPRVREDFQFGLMAGLNHNENMRRKRSKASTRVRDLASLNSILDSANHPTRGKEAAVGSDRQVVGDNSYASMEAVVAQMQSTLARKKRTKKRNSLVDPASSSTRITHVSYTHRQLFSGAPPELMWKEMSINAICEQFKYLSINRQHRYNAYEQQNAIVPYNRKNKEQNALALYTRDGTVVPYTAKPRKPRPKVDLDDETSRVWKLLLGNINSEGIDGTDEEKAKWWENERRVFRGRAESFIARMHLVQGDRRFSPWKGSVVDSVIGVFLTQNVSDHLSSSAFMSLAAHFPLKSTINEQQCNGEGPSSIIERPEFYVLDPDDILELNEKPMQLVGDQSSVTIQETGPCEDREVVNSNDLSGSSAGVRSSIDESKLEIVSDSPTYSESCHDSVSKGSDRQITERGNDCSRYDEATNDAVSSQNSMLLTRNSRACALAQNADRTGSSSESNSESGDLIKESKFDMLNSSYSFVKHLEMAGSSMLHEVPVRSDYDSSFNEILKTQGRFSDNLVDPKGFTGESFIPLADCHLTVNTEVIEIEHFEMFKEETRSSEVAVTKDENSVMEQNPSPDESAHHFTDQNATVTSVPMPRQSSGECNRSSNNAERDNSANSQCQGGLHVGCGILAESAAQLQNTEMQRQVNRQKQSELLDVTESSIVFDNQGNTRQKTKESNLSEHVSLLEKEHNEMEAATLKSKGKKSAKAKKEEFDWDSLRKTAEAGGKKRERTERTMDSLDYEAVRCADVNEIAQTIKERGMNNMLAERMKDFLNRLVRDHGSIDLEWLRDVPPDKAKEYLLSIRGLGLKSVECVRLLTLHHLAFPVDTNVGRIAVRLGWVPLQPLPESLQLHLLELYPVLESIQKYLWPRLCKLDQRTLYELHYQMITFGKVFCTKSKPNCNSCPMRGECRHFASAFASARLALPAPEEKGIVTATQNTACNPGMKIDQQTLRLPEPAESNTLSETKSRGKNCEPIVEEPSSPEPVCTQVSENDIGDIEDMFGNDPDEIPTIKLNMEEFTQTLQNFMQNNMELQEGDVSKALVALTAEAASLPTTKLKNVSRLRTEHQVYELPDSHPLLNEMDKREPDDPSKYLLAIWTPGETVDSIQPPEKRCSSQEQGRLCCEETCFSCNSVREAESHTVRGTLLIPCRTAMRGSFPLNGTYFQVNEVFADNDSSLIPIDVPREWLWNLPRRTVYFGTSIPSIFKGLTTEGIQHCFWRGFVCVRGFDQKTRAPRPLIARLHFPASKMNRGKGKAVGDE